MKKPEDFLLSPVDITIHQDWAFVVELTKNLIEQSKIKNSEVLPYGNSTFYHIGNLGSVVHHHISDNWHCATGPWTNKYMPWINRMMKDMKDLKPDYGIGIMIGNGAEHVDYPRVPTAFNYLINTTKAETYIKYEDQEYTYPSIEGQAWILNTQYPHGVRNNELRLVFNMHFEVPYEKVKQWFDARPGLVYS